MRGSLSYAAAGSTRRKKLQANGRKHGERHQNKPTKVVSYCPVCTIPNLGEPEKAVKVVVNVTKRLGMAKCPSGHVWDMCGKTRH